MKYIVITAKHHDGFAMFHSKADPFNIYDATPFKRDPLKELAAACAEAGHEARLLLLAGAGLDRAGRRARRIAAIGTRRRTATSTHYLETKAIPQIEELLRTIGPPRRFSGSTRRPRT